MSEHEHEHEHHHHHHEHEHHHHHHEHEHGEDCTCGCHDHEHEHHHHEHVHGRDEDGIHIEHHIQDEACVVSGVVRFPCADYEALRLRIAAQLEEVAAEITERGGIVGHVKAAAELTGTEMFSVTDVKAMMKTAAVQELTLKMAAIVFAIEPEETEALVEHALRTLRG